MPEIRTIEKPCCDVCGSKGEPLYEKLTDNFFFVPGQWNLYKCTKKECGLIWLNPVPIEEDLIVAYSNYYTHLETKNSSSFINKFYKKIQSEYLATKFGYGGTKNSLLKTLLYFDPDRLEQTKYEVMYLENIKGKLLDIGFGDGALMKFLNNFGWETIGIDFDEKVVDAAKSKNLNVKSGELKTHNFESDYFDIITLAHVIEHVYDPIGLISECFRILKRNGKIVIATPNNESFGHKYFEMNWRGLEPPRHLQIYSLKSLVKLLKQFDFKRVDFFTTHRIARYIYRSSVKPELANSSHRKINRSLKIKARLFSLFEWILIKLNFDLGEEIIVVAEK